MTTTATMPLLTYQGQPLNPDHLDFMADSMPLLNDWPAMRTRMREDGYVYLPGYLGRDRVLAARRVLVERLAKTGAFKPGTDPMDGIMSPQSPSSNFAGGRLEEMFKDWQSVNDVLYAGPMMAFFRSFFETDVRHYDYTWIRQVRPGPATEIHSDVVYMGRGTHDLFTAWTPMGDNNFDLGGLMVLAGSNNHQGLKKAYWQSDVDTYCENRPGKKDAWAKGHAGSLKGTANQLQRQIGGTWVTHDFRAGDVVLFNCYTVHGGTDNRSDRIRLSTDTRYQRAADAIDHRWVGEKLVGHGPEGKRGKIC